MGKELAICAPCSYFAEPHECAYYGKKGCGHHELYFAVTFIHLINYKGEELLRLAPKDRFTFLAPCRLILDGNSLCETKRNKCPNEHNPFAVLNVIDRFFSQQRGLSKCAALIEVLLTTPAPRDFICRIKPWLLKED